MIFLSKGPSIERLETSKPDEVCIQREHLRAMIRARSCDRSDLLLNVNRAENLHTLLPSKSTEKCWRKWIVRGSQQVAPDIGVEKHTSHVEVRSLQGGCALTEKPLAQAPR